jgi:predicted MFS family arabinose efflux permease
LPDPPAARHDPAVVAVDLELPYPRLRRAALGTAVFFAVSGAILGTWVSRLPATRDRLHASPAELGLALLTSGLGSLISMPFTGRLCRRWGSRNAVALTALPGCASLVALALAPSVPVLAVALFFFGLLFGAWDVAMNIQGSAVEQRAGRAWMPRYHGCWSVGGIAGAGLGGVAARLGIPVLVHFVVVAVAGAALVLAALRTTIEDRTAPDPPAADHLAGGRTALLTRRLILIGLITVCSVVLEGAAADWLAIYIVDARHVQDWAGAAGYATFATAMAAGRFAGTPITQRLGRARAVGIGGLITVSGVVLTVLGPWLGFAYLGTALWALGVCLVFPAAMSAAGESRHRPTDAIAAVATIGYAGILVGPPLIGFLAQRAGLGRALLVLVVLAALITVCSPAARREHEPAERS